MMIKGIVHKRKHNQSGFIAAQLIAALAASIAVMALAASYVSVWSKVIDNQKLIQSRNQATQMANILASSAEDYNGYVLTAPPTSSDSGGQMNTITYNYTNDDSQIVTGGKMPTGYSFKTRYSEPEYFSFIQLPKTGSTIPPGYFVGQRGGLPKPDQIAFAILLREPGVNNSYSMADIKQGIAHGNDILITRSIDQVGGNSWRTLAANAGNIPTCGVMTMPDGKRKYTMLKWSKDANAKTWRWSCDANNVVKDYAIANPLDANANIRCDTANNEALTTYTITDELGQTVYELDPAGIPVRDASNALIPKRGLRCVKTIAPQTSTEYGQYIDDQGNSHDLLNDRLGVAVPCSGGSDLIRITNGSDGLLNISCAGNSNSVALLRCSGDRFIAKSFSNYTTCFPYNWGNIALHPGPGARKRCQGGSAPYYADQKTYCPEDSIPSGMRLCADGFDAMNDSVNGGLGCYLSTNPNAPLDRSAITAAQYSPDYVARAAGCTDKQVLTIQSNERGLVACKNVIEILQSFLPGECPRVGNVAGALTWNGTNFTCTKVD